MALTKVSYSMIEGSPVNIDDFGAVGNGVANDSAAIQAAIDYLATNFDGGTVVCDPAKTYGIGTTVIVKGYVTLDFSTAKVIPLSNIDMINVNIGGVIKGQRFDTTGISYSAIAVKITPSTNLRGNQFTQPMVDISVRHEIGAGKGTSLYLDSQEYYIQGIEAHVVSYGGNTTLHLTRGDENLEYANGNRFVMLCHDPVNSILEDTTTGSGAASIRGNIYEVYIENNTNGAALTLHNGAVVIGSIWDESLINFKGSDNLIIGRPARSTLNVTDEGENNRIIGQDGNYFNGYSIGQDEDFRSSSLDMRGFVQFQDFFINGLSSVWSESGTGSTSTALIQNGGGSLQFVGKYVELETGATSTNSRQIDFGAGYLMTGMNPIIHATVSVPTESTTARIGFFTDANNHVFFESDTVNNRWIAISTSGGTPTTLNINSNDPANLNYITIKCFNSKVEFYLGNVAFGSDDIALGAGTQSKVATFTTNIPTGSLMTPYLFVRTDIANPAKLRIYDVQVVQQYNRLVP